MNNTPGDRLVPAAFLVLLIFVLASCLPDNNETSRSEVRVLLNMEEISTPAIAQGDTLRIELLKFIHGRSFFIRGDDTLYFKENPEIIVYQSGQNSGRLLAAGTLTEGSLSRMVFNIEQAPPAVQSVDPDFISGDTLYSLIIQGVYQDSSFIFKSTRDFTIPFDFESPLEAGSNALFNILIASEANSWFLSEGELLNPRDSANVFVINENIAESFRLQEIERF